MQQKLSSATSKLKKSSKLNPKQLKNLAKTRGGSLFRRRFELHPRSSLNESKQLFLHGKQISMDSAGYYSTLEQIVEDKFNEDTGQIVMMIKNDKNDRNDNRNLRKNIRNYNRQPSFDYSKSAYENHRKRPMSSMVRDSSVKREIKRPLSRQSNLNSSDEFAGYRNNNLNRPVSRNSVLNSSDEFSGLNVLRNNHSSIDTDIHNQRPVSSNQKPTKDLKTHKNNLIDQILNNDLDKDT